MLNKFWIKNTLSVAIFGCMTGLSSCSIQPRDNIALAEDKPTIVASHSVLCDLISTIAEDTVDLTCLIDGDRDPHTYSPTPQERKAMEKAQLILYGGYQLEPQIIQLIEATETAAPKLAVYERVVAEPIMAEHDHEEHEGEHDEGEHDHEEHDEGEHEGEHDETASQEKELEPDPHVWHNVENVVAMVELIQPILLQLNPSQATTYLQNSSATIENLWQLDAWIKEQIQTIPEGKRILVTTHNSLNYYVRAYRLEEYKTLQGLSSESSPTASKLRDLATEIEQTGVSTIFVESTSSDRVMSNVARAANVELSLLKLFVDGLGEADNYVEMMSHNTCAIVNGLEGKCQSFDK